MSNQSACPKCDGYVTLQRCAVGDGLEYRCHNCTHVLDYREILTRHRRPMVERPAVARFGTVVRVGRPSWAVECELYATF